MNVGEWVKLSREWEVRKQALNRKGEGGGFSWRHKCASSSHWNYAKRTDAGKVRCKACGHMVPGGLLMLMNLQKLAPGLVGEEEL